MTGRLGRLTRSEGGWSISIESGPWPSPLVIGESIAVQGACLTVTAVSPNGFSADILDETFRLTAISELRAGSLLNLERALALGDRLGGHLVTGHVDETGTIFGLTPEGRDLRVGIACSPAFSSLTVVKGSIALDGVSLTVTAVREGYVEVAVIPHTRAVTSLSERRVGDRVNLEGDILGKYVARCLGKAPVAGITETLLRENGFL
ncbi:MAG: riboflavin synthase [Kiritimatiellae bacterium]|nr:riboflavin synthase [Kiritimatiellia bacterium]